ncbi:response regulator [Alkalitalea saponilacus]|uniref:DNA-binding response regulator, NarL/FixJ family, contains REC and HTH domains n=1 Tax=Alkalitalea saponilacus TaxID=889453 RepID=A0A1T5D591_9BACT|nr:response regulator transcription factor [Alkalitalea saponilacus]ASB50576.1 DNA-binding response regulator [Alkalitalea saponilacus]SKB66680.1 DNA-binding response regulator, NarL/FixJ family, contains REC and HTH domains [Alkalitalea saponilacus]
MINTKKIIIVDDHKIVRDGIRAMLLCNKSFSVVGDLASGKELFQQLNSLTPDIVILDIGMPEMNGVEITGKLNREYPAVKVLILSANASEDWIVSAIKAGAVGFLPKECSSGELIKALRHISRGENYYGESIASIIYRSYVNILRDKESPKRTEELTERESDVLKAFSEGLSFKEIADKLCISPRTVESHKINILNKLELKNTIEMVKYAIKNGIIDL